MKSEIKNNLHKVVVEMHSIEKEIKHEDDNLSDTDLLSIDLMCSNIKGYLKNIQTMVSKISNRKIV